MRARRLAWLFFKVGSLNELQYRANFFIQLLQSAVSVGVALVVLALVYSQTTELNGWSESELIVVLGIQILLGGVIRTTIQPNMQRLMEDVRDGKLDFALTKPEDSQVLVSIRDVQIWRAVDVIAGAAVLAYGIDGLDAGVGVGDVLLFLGLLAARRGHDLLLLARDRDARVLDRQRLGDHRALRRHLPDRSLADLDLSRAGCASASPSSSRSRSRSPCRRRRSPRGSSGRPSAIAIGFAVGALRLHALVVGLRPAPLLGRLGLEAPARPRRAGLRARRAVLVVVLVVLALAVIVVVLVALLGTNSARQLAVLDQLRIGIGLVHLRVEQVPAPRRGSRSASMIPDDSSSCVMKPGAPGVNRAGSNVATWVSASSLDVVLPDPGEIRPGCRDPPAASRCRARRRRCCRACGTARPSRRSRSRRAAGRPCRRRPGSVGSAKRSR